MGPPCPATPGHARATQCRSPRAVLPTNLFQVSFPPKDSVLAPGIFNEGVAGPRHFDFSDAPSIPGFDSSSCADDWTTGGDNAYYAIFRSGECCQVSKCTYPFDSVAPVMGTKLHTYTHSLPLAVVITRPECVSSSSVYNNRVFLFSNFFLCSCCASPPALVWREP